jgi:hypothetical protein
MRFSGPVCKYGKEGMGVMNLLCVNAMGTWGGMPQVALARQGSYLRNQGVLE